MKACFATHGFGHHVDCTAWAKLTDMKHLPNKLHPKKKKMQMGGPEDDNKFNPTPPALRRKPDYGMIGPVQPAVPNYGPIGPSPYAPSAQGSDCPEGMIWDQEMHMCTYDNGYNPSQEEQKNQPKGLGPKSTPKTGPGTGVNPQDHAKVTQSNAKVTQSNKIDPYFILQGATTGLEWLSGIVARNRQNQYMNDQFSTLGQNTPGNIMDYQPNAINPGSAYAQMGGKVAYSWDSNTNGNPVWGSYPLDEYKGWQKSAFPGNDGKEEWMKLRNEIDYMKNNTPESNIYHPQYMHHSINPTEQLPIAKKGGMMRGKHKSKFMGKMTDKDMDECTDCKDTDMDEMKKGGNWLKGAVNPAHKGWCTPLSNPKCTGHRRAFALMMKKNHGFHGSK